MNDLDILKPPRTTDVECKLYNSDSPRVQDPTQLRLDTTMQVRPAVPQVPVIYIFDISTVNRIVRSSITYNLFPKIMHLQQTSLVHQNRRRFICTGERNGNQVPSKNPRGPFKVRHPCVLVLSYFLGGQMWKVRIQQFQQFWHLPIPIPTPERHLSSRVPARACPWWHVQSASYCLGGTCHWGYICRTKTCQMTLTLQ